MRDVLRIWPYYGFLDGKSSDIYLEYRQAAYFSPLLAWINENKRLKITNSAYHRSLMTWLFCTETARDAETVHGISHIHFCLEARGDGEGIHEYILVSFL